MPKKPIEVSFFEIQANFSFTDTNFTEAKFDKDPFKVSETVSSENQY